MSYYEIITALISLVAIVISLTSLRRTRIFNKKQLALDEEIAKLAKLQIELLEKDIQEQLAIEEMKRDLERQEQIRQAQEKQRKEAGNPILSRGLYYGWPGIGLLNNSDFAVKDVSVRLSTDDDKLQSILDQSIEKLFPIQSLGSQESVYIVAGDRYGPIPKGPIIATLTWSDVSGMRWERQEILK